MPSSGRLWNGGWINIFLCMGKKIFHDFAFFETVIGDYYLPGSEILPKVHKQAARDSSTGEDFVP